MIDFIEDQKNKWYLFVKKHAEGPHVKVWLASVSFLEAIIFPIPTSAFLIAVYMAGAKRFWFYAFFTTFFSIVGGVVGYFVGYFFFDTIGVRIVDFYNLGSELEKVKELYGNNAFWVTFTGAFTPIPYKVFTLSAGFLKVNFLYFFLASVIGRGLQFFLVAYIMKLFGETATKLFLKYFNYVVLVAIFILFLLVI